ncbi:xanthine dehydrogenase family protein molybdopterin-binding subunit [Acidiphilium sp.]|uniref:xanthine dehydrogenase family protein molybdopterin-binding subunit n=1 Tax=Acidiphilium sp. TaxID=527 RepID=UPI003D08410C
MTVDDGCRSEVFPCGILGVGLATVTRQVPQDEPPPWPPNAALAVVGRSAPRSNGRDKVTGATRFTVDVGPRFMLHAAMLRSPLAHAEISSIDTTEAMRHAGVRAIEIIARPRDPLTGVVRYIGAPVAAVAAESRADAEAALRLIKVVYHPLPFVVDLLAARLPGAPLVHDAASAPQGHPSGFPAAAGLALAGNVRGPARRERGDLAAGFAAASVIVEADYSTQVQTHCCMETHAIVADWQDDGLTVHMSTQFTAGVRHELAEAFDLPLSRVRVVVDGMGGGFGSKSSLGTYGRVAVALSRDAGAPVRLVLDRMEEQMDTGNRPSTTQHLRIGARSDGTLTAVSVVSYGTAGVAVGAGIGGFAETLYAVPHFASDQYDVFTNAGPGSAMRGPGNTPGAWAVEQAVDELAERLAIDALVLRDRIDPSPVRREERRLGALRIGWAGRHAPGSDPGPVKRGIGVAQSLWPANVQTNAACEVRVMRDGSVEVRSGVQDIGTGVGTIMAQVVAEVLGLRPEQIAVRIGDTDFPAGPPSYGSRTTASITPPARTAAWQVLQMLLREAGLALNAAPADLIAASGRIMLRDQPERGLDFGEVAARLPTDQIGATAARGDDYGGFRRRMGDAAIARHDLGGVQFAQVAVDTETGVIKVERVVAVHDCGRPINPKQLESQVQGGVLMGMSYALFETRVLDRHSGRMLNADLEAYKLAGPADTPDIEVIILENYQGENATDAYGIAEPANIATAPAIANAVYNAIGVRLRSLPMTPAAVLAALGDNSARLPS